MIIIFSIIFICFLLGMIFYLGYLITGYSELEEKLREILDIKGE